MQGDMQWELLPCFLEMLPAHHMAAACTLSQRLLAQSML